MFQDQAVEKIWDKDSEAEETMEKLMSKSLCQQMKWFFSEPEKSTKVNDQQSYISPFYFYFL